MSHSAAAARDVLSRRQHMLADVSAIIGSLDIVFGEISDSSPPVTSISLGAKHMTESLGERTARRVRRCSAASAR
jgi:uncharacterized protein YoxC